MLQQAAFAEKFQTDFRKKVWIITMHRLCIHQTLVPMLLLLLNELAALVVIM